jgi:Hyaluronidase protein (HylP)
VPLTTSIVENVTLDHDTHHAEIHTKVNALTVGAFSGNGAMVGLGTVTTPAKILDVASTVQAAQFKTTAASNNSHAITAWQAANDAALTNASAANFPSDNEFASSVQVSGPQRSTGTVKIRHDYPGTSDANAAGLSIDLAGAGTAAQGIFLDSAGATTGRLLTIRNNTSPRLSLLGNGNLGLGTETAFGGGVGVIGIANAGTVPSTNPSGGGVLYVEAGALKYRGSSGTVTPIAAA